MSFACLELFGRIIFWFSLTKSQVNHATTKKESHPSEYSDSEHEISTVKQISKTRNFYNFIGGNQITLVNCADLFHISTIELIVYIY